jgi:4-amino-4-deoxychorismate lyase
LRKYIVDRWLINGVASNSLPVADRGLSYGDGLFETIAVRAGQCRFLTAHLDRLAEGCDRLGIPAPDRQQISDELGQLIAATEYASAKIIITRGTGPRGYQPPIPCQPTRILGLQATSPVAGATRGVRVRYCETSISRNPALAGIKTLNRLEQVLARAEWDDTDIAEGLMLNDRGEVVCGTMCNLFFTRAGILFTPELRESGVNGIMRKMVLQVAQGRGVEVSELTVSKADLETAEDIFLSNALIGVWPVVELNGKKYQRSDVTKQIMQGLFEMGVIECGI